jgi:hypothetical protein
MGAAYLLILIFLVLGILWIINIPMLSKWKHNKLFFTLNATLFTVYTFYLTYGNPTFIGHDEYGLQRFGYIIFTPIVHIVISFFIVIFIRVGLKK